MGNSGNWYRPDTCGLVRVSARSDGSRDLVEVFSGTHRILCKETWARVDFQRTDVVTNEIVLEWERGTKYFYIALCRIQLVGTTPPVPPHPIAVDLQKLAELPEWIRRKAFVIENIDLLHDCVVRISFGEESASVSFRCLRSLLAASTTEEGGPGRDLAMAEVLMPMRDGAAFVPPRCQIVVHSPAIHLSEERFLGFLLGSVSVADLSQEPDDILDLYEILSKLHAKKAIWYLCEKIAESVVSDDDALVALFQKAFARFEEELEDPDDVIFTSALTYAAMEGMKKSKERILEKRAHRVWFHRNLLYTCLNASSPPVRSHNELQSLDDSLQLLSPEELFLLEISHCECPPNVELRAGVGEGLLRCHIESLVLCFEFFVMLLRSDRFPKGKRFRDERTIELENFSLPSIELLVEFARTGGFGDSSPPLSALVLLLFHSGSIPQDSHLTEHCVSCLKAVNTRDGGFVDQLLSVGYAFQDCVSKDEVLDEWASQGVYTRSKLGKKLRRVIERAELAGLRTEVGDLRTEVRELRARLARLEEKFDESSRNQQ